MGGAGWGEPPEGRRAQLSQHSEQFLLEGSATEIKGDTVSKTLARGCWSQEILRCNASGRVSGVGGTTQVARCLGWVVTKVPGRSDLYLFATTLFQNCLFFFLSFFL